LEVGLIVNSADPEFPPPGLGFVTLTAAVPEFAMSAEVICTCNCVPDVYVVVRALPFHCTLDEGMKLYPVIVTVNAAPPALDEFGLREAMAGTALEGGGGGGD
jgi:hypothetical protein